MHHKPGYRKEDIYNFIGKDKTVYTHVILSTGRNEMLRVSPDIISYIKSKGIPNVFVLETAKAIQQYIVLRSQHRGVAIFIHTTC
jgi:hypothetical protein